MMHTTRLLGMCSLVWLAGMPESAQGKEDDASVPEDNASAVQVSTEHVSMNLHLLIQGGLHVFPNQATGERSAFALERAKIALSGHLVSKNLTYLLQGDGAAGMHPLVPALPGAETAALPGAGSVPFLLDAWVRFHIPSIGLLITFGRFIPSLGIMMGEDPAKLGTATYPLYIFGGINALGTFRDIGLEMQIKLGNAVFLGGGVFNGGFNNWKEDNDRKDLSAFITLSPGSAFILRASSLFKFRNVQDGVDQLGNPVENGVETHITPCIEARYKNNGFDVIAGYAMDFTVRDDRDTREDDKAMGAFGHFGYLFLGDLLELAARFDWWEKSMRTESDRQYRITVGPTVYLETARLALRINYIQDIFANETAMCETYLHRDDCADIDEIAEAKKTASTLLFQVTSAF